MADYCAAFPDRLKGVIVVAARDVKTSLAELQRAAKESWPLAVFVYAPYQFPLDHPDLEPIWKTAADNDLSIALHTFTVMPPYAPGGLDSWDNLWLQRSAAHPWCGQRNMASIIGAGIMDRYPNIRVGTLEAGHGWLPAWVNRLEEHTKLCPGGAAAAQTNHPRVRDRRALFPEHRGFRRRRNHPERDRSTRLGHTHVWFGLSSWRKLVPCLCRNGSRLAVKAR